MAYDIVVVLAFDIWHIYQGNVGDLGFFPIRRQSRSPSRLSHALPWLAFVAGWYTVLVAAACGFGRWSYTSPSWPIPFVADRSVSRQHPPAARRRDRLGFRYPAAWSVRGPDQGHAGNRSALVRRSQASGAISGWPSAHRRRRGGDVRDMPTQWIAYLTVLVDSAGTPPPWPALPIPLWVRMPAAAAVVVWGARRTVAGPCR